MLMSKGYSDSLQLPLPLLHMGNHSLSRFLYWVFIIFEQEEEEDEHQQKESNGGSLIRRIWLESKKIWAVVGPSIFSRLAMFSMTVITQAFAGHLSDLDLAAISVATTVIIAITTVIIAISFDFKEDVRS